jgi:hypothetical protein
MFPIVFDTSALTFTFFIIPELQPTDVQDGATSPTLMLNAGKYSFQQASGNFADSQFEVTAAGTLDYDPKFDTFLSGRGTSTLKINGFAITLDGTALSHGLVLLVASNVEVFLPDSIHTLVLAPAPFYSFAAGSGNIADFVFGVDLNGNVVIDPKFSGFAEGAGSNRLTIRGYTIEIDGRELSHELLPGFLNVQNFLPFTKVNSITLIPAPFYGLVAGSGIISKLVFGVDLNGNVVIDPKFSGFAEATGNLLTIRGYVVQIDGRRLTNGLLPGIERPNNEFLPSTAVNSLTLIPADGYGFIVDSGTVADMSFDVGIDGRLDYPIAFDGFLQGRGSNLLLLLGYPVLIDATQSDSGLSILTFTGPQAQAPRFLFAMLLPTLIGYQFQSKNGVFQKFFLDRNGNVNVNMNTVGRLVASTIPRIEVISTM